MVRRLYRGKPFLCRNSNRLKASRQIKMYGTLKKKDRVIRHKFHAIVMVLIAFSPTSNTCVFLLEWNLFCLALHQNCVAFFLSLFSFLRIKMYGTLKKKDRVIRHKFHAIVMVLIAFSPTSNTCVVLLEWNLFCLALHQNCVAFFLSLFSFLRSSPTDAVNYPFAPYICSPIPSFTWTHVKSTAQRQRRQIIDTFVNFPLPLEFSAVPYYHSMVRPWRHESYRKQKYSTKQQQNWHHYCHHSRIVEANYGKINEDKILRDLIFFKWCCEGFNFLVFYEVSIGEYWSTLRKSLLFQSLGPKSLLGLLYLEYEGTT